MRGRWNVRRGVAALVGVAAVLAVLGCDPKSDVTPADAGAPSAPASGTAAPGQAAPAGNQGTASRFDAEFQQALGLVVDYWTAEFAANKLPFAAVKNVVPYTRDGELSCGGHPLPTQNAFYCPNTDLLGYDVNWIRAGYQKIGDSFLYLLVAHEYGHAIQWRVLANRLVSRTYELQADCLAGAAIGDSSRAGTLELEHGDAREIMTTIMAIADPDGTPWFDTAAHGSPDDRLAAFSRGYRGSYDECHLDSLNGTKLTPRAA